MDGGGRERWRVAGTLSTSVLPHSLSPTVPLVLGVQGGRHSDVLLSGDEEGPGVDTSPILSPFL